jgi:kynurenine formamidase
MTTEPLTGLADLEPVDLSHPLAPGIDVWPSHPPYAHELAQCYTLGDPARLFRLEMGEHTGTHLDAPLHFVPGGADIAQAPLDIVNSRAAVLRAPEGSTEVSLDVLVSFESAHGRIGPRDTVLIDCGWSSRWGTPEYFERWPSVSVELARALVDRQVGLVAVDAPSPDRPDSPDFPCHKLLLGADVLIGENFTNLGALSGWAPLVVAPLPIVDGSGSPVRAVAYRSRTHDEA